MTLSPEIQEYITLTPNSEIPKFSALVEQRIEELWQIPKFKAKMMESVSINDGQPMKVHPVVNSPLGSHFHSGKKAITISMLGLAIDRPTFVNEKGASEEGFHNIAGTLAHESWHFFDDMQAVKNGGVYTNEPAFNKKVFLEAIEDVKDQKVYEAIQTSDTPFNKKYAAQAAYNTNMFGSRFDNVPFTDEQKIIASKVSDEFNVFREEVYSHPYGDILQKIKNEETVNLLPDRAILTALEQKLAEDISNRADAHYIDGYKLTVIERPAMNFTNEDIRPAFGIQEKRVDYHLSSQDELADDFFVQNGNGSKITLENAHDEDEYSVFTENEGDDSHFNYLKTSDTLNKIEDLIAQREKEIIFIPPTQSSLSRAHLHGAEAEKIKEQMQGKVMLASSQTLPENNDRLEQLSKPKKQNLDDYFPDW